MKTKPGHNAIFLTIPVAAEIIGVNPPQLRTWIDYGVIDAIRDRKTIKLCRNLVEKLRDRILSGDIPDMSCVPVSARIEKYKPLRLTLNSIIHKKNTCTNKPRVTFDEYFKNR